MNKHFTFNCTIDLNWNIIQQLRDKLASLVQSYGENLAYACKITSSELVENAVKYGCHIDSQKGIDVSLSVKDNEVRISVVNGIINKADLENVITHIDAINASYNPRQLYVARLKALLDNPEQNQSQLGLYRIAFEGEFRLDYDYDHQLNALTVTARKNIIG